ncbi:MAG: MerR family transcriptional regulator [Clostridiales bacterium]|nr:MerR family transcriptional regulator [Clostridiales bacterium]
MLISEVCKKCRLTKKAIEYYTEQALVQPETLDNGYRSFSDADIERLKKIAVLRRLGFSVQSIKEVLDGGGQKVLYKISERKRIEIEAEETKQALIQQLAEKQDWEYINAQLEVLEKSQMILQRILDVFPGCYGKYISLHFAQYLNEPVVSAEQQEAFGTVIEFLDNVDFVLPPDLQQYLDEITKDFDEAFVEKVSANMNDAISDTEKYIAENKEILERYMQLKQSNEFRTSPGYRLQEQLRKFNSESGYDTVFIPAIKKLSRSYRKYHDKLAKANEVFLSKYSNEAQQLI